MLLFFRCGFSQNDSLSTKQDYKQYFYSTGKISSEGYLKDNKPTGYWISYYNTGIKRSEGKWKNNKLDSTWIFYDFLGDTTEKIDYYEGNKNGFQLVYFKEEENKNKVRAKELFVTGKRNGKSYYYHTNGNVHLEISYLDDKKHGLSYEYNKEGEIISIIRYRYNEKIVHEQINRYNEKNQKEGVWKDFYENGQVKEEKNYKEDKLHGIYKHFNEKGDLLQIVQYKEGNIDTADTSVNIDIDIKETYDNNGNKIFEGSYKGITPIGVHRTFNEKGKVIKSITYNINGEIESEGIVLINGKEEGNWKYFYENGTAKAEGKFNNGEKTGKWKYYYPNGKLQQTGDYTNGKLSGIWVWYYDTGELLREEYYIYGKLDGEATEFDKLGNVIAKGNYMEGYKEGEWIYRSGDQTEKGNYVMGEKNGVWKSFYKETEELAYSGKFVQGAADGKHIYYYPNGSVKEERYYDTGTKIKNWTKYYENGELLLVVQYRDGIEYKINGVKINLNQEEE